MTTLYRKYRPHVFADCVDQEHIITTITNELKTDSIAHAYLFAGPRGVGKTTMARLLAKAVNCQKRKKGDAEPCDECSSCKEIAEGRSIDVFEMDAASHTQVDKVRDNILENINFGPTSSKYKVFIIDEVHMLSTSAFNALLKTLEEPPAHCLFILATTELHKLPPTVVSRCERFQFKKIGYDTMRARLDKICKAEGVKVDDDVIDRVIKKSEGGLRDAESLLGQVLSLGGKKITAEAASAILPSSQSEQAISYLEHLASGSTKDALTFINALAADGINLDQFAFDLIDLLRVILIAVVSGGIDESAVDYSKEDLKRLAKLQSAWTAGELTSIIDLALKRRAEMKSSPLPQLPLELFTVEAVNVKNNSGIRPTPPGPAAKAPIVEKMTVKEKEPEKPIIEQRVAEPAPSPTPAPAAVPDVPARTTVVTLDEIKKRWKDIINTVDEAAHSLTFILNMCVLKNLSGDKLEVTVPYSLHKEKIEELKNRKLIENAFEKVIGERITVVCEVLEAPAPQENTIQNLVAEFGGELVG